MELNARYDVDELYADFLMTPISSDVVLECSNELHVQEYKEVPCGIRAYQVFSKEIDL